MRCLLPLLFLLAEATAQDRQLTVQNLAPFARQEWAQAVVPFPRGTVRDLPALHVQDRQTVWQPIGARWPDGSLRQALCLFRVEMAALSELNLALRPGRGPAPAPAPTIDPVRAGSARLRLLVSHGGATSEGSPAFVRQLEANAARTVGLYRCRVGGSGLLCEVIVTAWAGQRHAQVDLGVFFSDPTSKAMEAPVGRVELVCDGMRLVLRHADRLAMRTAFTPTGSRTTLLQDTVLGDGQGIRRSGVLAPRLEGRDPRPDQTLQAAALVPVLAATSWRDTGAYGPFGVVPAPPPWLRGRHGRAALARRHARFVAAGKAGGDPFRHFPFALVKDPGATGKQNDFGILKLAPVASTGMPSFLLEVEPSVLQEACRPVHFFEADGSPLAARNHPDWVQWDGRTHWNCSVAKDRLGKPCPPPRFRSHGWKGKDRQHWSSNYLCGYYLLTGSHQARREIENEVQLFLGGQTVRAGIATSGPGAPRAVGRMLLLGCWLFQCTGDQALLQRMHDRMENSYRRGFDGAALAADRVRPYAIRGPSGNALGGKVRFWTPWEECIAVTGFVAFHRLTGSPTAWQLAEAVSLNALRHGWLVDAKGARVGYQLRFQAGGEPLTHQQLVAGGDTVATWAGGGIGEWSMAAVQVALHFAKLRQDAALTAKAEQILALLRRGRDRPPADGWWDDYREWDAITVAK